MIFCALVRAGGVLVIWASLSRIESESEGRQRTCTLKELRGGRDPIYFTVVRTDCCCIIAIGYRRYGFVRVRSFRDCSPFFRSEKYFLSISRFDLPPPPAPPSPNPLLSPAFAVLYVPPHTTPQTINAEYGAKSTKAALASKSLDASLGVAFEAMSTGAGRRLTSQLVVGPALSQKLAVGGRRLQCAHFLFVFFCSEKQNTTKNKATLSGRCPPPPLNHPP